MTDCLTDRRRDSLAIRFARFGAFLLLAFAGAASTGNAQDTPEENLERARVLWKTGRAAEAVEIYDALLADAKTWSDDALLWQSWLGRGQARSELGGRSAAKAGLEWIA